MDQALNSQKTPHTSPLRASYGMSFVSILMKNDRVIKGFYCTFIRPEIIELYLVSTDRTGNTCWNLVLHSNRLRFFRNVVAWCGAGVDCGNSCPFHLELTSYASYITMHDCKPFSHVKHTLCVWTSSTATLVIINLHTEVSWENEKWSHSL